MKIIDQKGRLFGLINIIDLLVVLLLLSFIPLLYRVYETFKLEKNMVQELVFARVEFSDMTPEFVKVVSKGDTEKDASGNLVGKLVNISSAEPSKVWVVVDNKILGAISHPTKKDLIIDAMLLCAKRDGVLFYKNSQVKIGNTISFTTDLYNFTGKIVGLKFIVKNK